ncbi:MAG: hypothetical protein KY460_03585 [Actinobacteria bacterium]|nr:hypothetical protein [Actinomycetota bacterium]
MTQPPVAPAGQQMADRALWLAVLVAAVAAVLAAAAGVPTHATYGARTTADEPQYLLTAISLASDRDLDISDELDAQRWRAFHEVALPQQTRALAGGRRISPHDPLLPMVTAPAVALGGWIAAKWMLVAVAGVTAALLVWTAVRRLAVRPRTAGLVVGVLAASVPLAPYGSQVYPELPAALAVTVALSALLAPVRTAGAVTVVASCVALPWLGVKYAPVAMALAGAVALRLWRDQRRWTAFTLAGGLAVAGVAYLVVHQVVWTGWTVYASADHFVDSGELGVVGFAPDYGARSVRLAALLTERSFGIAAWQPAWLLAVPAVTALLRARPTGWGALAATLAAGWMTATFVALTMAGWWFPGRQVVVVLPAVVLATAWWLDGHVRARHVFTVAGLLGVATWLWLTVEAATGSLTLVVDFFDTTNPLYRGWRWLLPDFLTVTPGTWVRHVVWSVILVAMAVAGWRRSDTNAHADAPITVTAP